MPTSAGIAAEFVKARTRAGSPAMGMVLTMVVVADEDDADRAMDMAREASHEHPARVLGVILGDADNTSPAGHRLTVESDTGAAPAILGRPRAGNAQYGYQ